MKGKKLRSFKQRIREERRNRQRIVLVLVLVAVVAIPGLLVYSFLAHSSTTQAVSFKAAIIDQLSGTFPNASFTADARSVLKAAGYSVDYYAPDQVTVDLFRSLPSKGYGLVIVRAHSTGWVAGSPITIFTSELWRADRYVYEQLTGTVQAATLSESNETYFTIHWGFVRYVMEGRFSNSLIIMMGCTGLKDSEMAQAFIDRGAKVYVSWDKSVTAGRTDQGTMALLHSLASGKNVAEAVNAAMSKVGPDSILDSHLGFYPEGQGGLALTLPTSQAPMLSTQTILETCIRGRIPSQSVLHYLSDSFMLSHESFWEAIP